MADKRKFELAVCVLAAAAAGASLWAALAGAGCASCQASADLLGGKLLAWAGLLGYAAVAAMVGARRWARAALWGLAGAGGAHLLLVVLLIYKGMYCPPCLTTAGAAWAALAIALLRRLGKLVELGLAVVAGGLVVLAGVMIAQQVVGWDANSQAKLLLDRIVAEQPAVPRGHALMIIYVREGCEHCKRFDRDVLPSLQKRFGDQLAVEHRQARRWMETPTIFLLGANTRYYSVGPMPSLEISLKVAKTVGSPSP